MAEFNIGWDSSLPTTEELISPTTVDSTIGSRATTGGINLNWQKLLGNTNQDYLGAINGPTQLQMNGPSPLMQNIGLGINAFAGLAGAYNGFQQIKLGKQQLQQNKQIFNLNFANQAKMINAELEDRQRARVAANPGAFDSVDNYMKKNALSTRGI